LGVLVSGVFTYTNDRNSSAYRNKAIRLKTDLATALNDTGRPVVVALGNVTAARRVAPAREVLAILRDRAVSLAQSEIGNQSTCKTRAAFYRFEEGGRRLVRVSYQGWAAGCKAPRTEFVSGRSDHDDEVIKFAVGEDSLLVRDLENYPPAHFADAKGRSYKSFVSVPVRAGTKSFGLLTADADHAYALTDIDEGYLVLIAGALAAGLAHVETVEAHGN
jgi:putative methionine-R-sulfoxide reductase with GAF domain